MKKMEIMEKMEKTPLVSVIIPAYNAVSYIQSALVSVLVQTISDLEIIVIDDGSTDETMKIVKQIAEKDDRVKCYFNEKNMGTAKTRNRGLDLSNGRYAAFLDSDDQWHPNKLEKQLACMKETGADLVYSAYAIVDEQGMRRGANFSVPPVIDIDGLLKNNVIGCSTVLVSRAVMERYRFVEEFYHEDYALWLRMLQDGCMMAGVKDTLVDYRYRSDSRAGNKVKSAKQRWRIYRDYLKLSVLESVWYLGHYMVAGIIKYKKCILI